MAMQLNTMMQMKCNQYATLYVILANNVCGKYKETSPTKKVDRSIICNIMVQICYNYTR